MLRSTPPMVIGGKELETLVGNVNYHWWGMGVIFLTEMAHIIYGDKHYWIARKNTGEYISISGNMEYKCLGWGTIRSNKDGFMELCHVMPKEAEKILRTKTCEKILKEVEAEKDKQLLGVLHKFGNERD